VRDYKEMETRLMELEMAVNSLIEVSKGHWTDKDEAMKRIDQEVERAYPKPARR
jgi:hypothetical protein